MLKAAGIDEVLIYCVNDGAVMEAWAADHGVEGSMVTFLADTRRELTEALGRLHVVVTALSQSTSSQSYLLFCFFCPRRHDDDPPRSSERPG